MNGMVLRSRMVICSGARDSQSFRTRVGSTLGFSGSLPFWCSETTKDAMSKCYFYKLTCDDGGAPCVQDGLLSLAICKPMIRSTAEVGDLIFGFAAKSLFGDNRLIYIAWVTDKKSEGEYYLNKRFSGRGDRIYRR